MELFLQKTVKYVIRCRTPFDQQMCESFNSVKAQFASKSISWKVSWAARVMCAVMQMNCGGNWKLELAEKCGIHLSDETRGRLVERYAKDIAQNAIRRTPERQEKEAKRRRAVKDRARLNRMGVEDYRLPLVSMDTAVALDPHLSPDPDEFEDPEEQIVPLDPDEIPADRPALPVPGLVEYTPPAAPFVIQLLLPASHWVSPPMGDYGFARPEADQGGIPEEEEEEEGEEEEEEAGEEEAEQEESDTLPEIPVYLEDDAPGVEFRVVMEEGGKQCTLVYGGGRVDPEAFIRPTEEEWERDALPAIPVSLEDDAFGIEFSAVGDEREGEQCTLVCDGDQVDPDAFTPPTNDDTPDDDDDVSVSLPPNYQMTRWCQAVLAQLLAVDSAFRFFALFPGEYEIDHIPMCLADVQQKLDNSEYESTDGFAQDVQQVLADARSVAQLPQYLHETASKLAVTLDLMIAALPHRLNEEEKRSPLQRLMELRFARYRTAKGRTAKGRRPV
jgi:hypothetical protein